MKLSTSVPVASLGPSASAAQPSTTRATSIIQVQCLASRIRGTARLCSRRDWAGCCQLPSLWPSLNFNRQKTTARLLAPAVLAVFTEEVLGREPQFLDPKSQGQPRSAEADLRVPAQRPHRAHQAPGVARWLEGSQR